MEDFIAGDDPSYEYALAALERNDEFPTFEDFRDGSLCNLGRTAPNPVLTTLKYFHDEYKAHIEEGLCPALVCRELILYYIEPPKCSKLCNVCVGSCPTEAIYTRDDGLKAIDQDKCVKCDNCRKAGSAFQGVAGAELQYLYLAYDHYRFFPGLPLYRAVPWSGCGHRPREE